MKRFGFTLLALLLGVAHATVFTPAQLAELVKNPTRFKPTAKESGQVNERTPTTEWRWGGSLEPDLTMSWAALAANWSLHLSSKSYKLSTVAPIRKALFSINDLAMNQFVTGYSISSGPFKNQYVLETEYSDGSKSVEVVTKGFALKAGQGSDYSKNSEAKMYSYPLYGFLAERKFFCSLQSVTC